MAMTVHRVHIDDESDDQMGFGGDTQADNLTSEQRKVFRVLSDTDIDTITANSADGIPVRGDAYDESHPLLLANSVRSRPMGFSRRAFTVEVGYTSVPYNPISADPKETWDTVQVEEPIDQDVDGNPITNKADESFDPPITREFADLVMTRSKNLPAFNTAFWYPFIDTLNNASYRGFGIGTARCVSVSAQSQTLGTFFFWRVTFQVAFRTRRRRLVVGGTVAEHGWNRVLLHQGFRERAGVIANKVVYNDLMDKNGLPTTKPMMLNQSGGLLLADDDVNWLEFQVYPLLSTGKTFNDMDAA